MQDAVTQRRALRFVCSLRRQLLIVYYHSLKLYIGHRSVGVGSSNVSVRRTKFGNTRWLRLRPGSPGKWRLKKPFRGAQRKPACGILQYRERLSPCNLHVRHADSRVSQKTCFEKCFLLSTVWAYEEKY